MTSSYDVPFDMVIVGATGDLAMRKLLPALYVLDKSRELASDGRIFAISRDGNSQAFLEQARAGVREHLEDETFSKGEWQGFVRRLSYHPMDATDAAAWRTLAQDLSSDGRVRIFYLATHPSIYGPVSRAIADAEAVTAESRIVLEKPIGSDLESAREINASVGEAFAEEQIYRIDHYLGKETVQNLMALRFGNALFEPLWSSRYVDHVQITVAEELGMEGRAETYDQIGALRDMMQNHILQLLCLVAMEPPPRQDPEALRDEKIKVLRSLCPMSCEQVARKTVRGQYDGGVVRGRRAEGYLQEQDVPAGSATETFVSIKAEIANWRWAGVPFYLRTGKRMGYRVSEIILTFKPVPFLLFEDQLETMRPNRLLIRLQPDEGVRLDLMTKEPGAGMLLKPTQLAVSLSASGKRSPKAYERLLVDVIRGKATLFIRRDEVEAAWGWIDPIRECWQKDGGSPELYHAGTWGPAAAKRLIEDDGRAWYEDVVGD